LLTQHFVDDVLQGFFWADGTAGPKATEPFADDHTESTEGSNAPAKHGAKMACWASSVLDHMQDAVCCAWHCHKTTVWLWQLCNDRLLEDFSDVVTVK